MKLTASQTKELQLALRQHPGIYRPARKAVATRLTGMGLFEITGDGFKLTKEGLDLAVRVGAQRIIDRVNEARPAAAVAVRPTSRQGPAGPPTHWPFPVSGHDW